MSENSDNMHQRITWRVEREGLKGLWNFNEFPATIEDQFEEGLAKNANPLTTFSPILHIQWII